ncbi:MAG: hypothetical protein H9791_10625 [Candidatus Bacteroides intestinipullorum]|uniref:Cytochrome c domain-containing protein n=1 Tax=Candidatus Bacteroides intestinipullorum TaxID=2838471 RepID=A0A9E2KIT3_9BACE|nr:hypothetical protein [Candidatus Bacteroides intestinipullorum]
MSLLALLAVTASCDDGRLYADRLIIPEEGRVVKLTATLEGLDTWSDGYSIVLAGFEDGSDYTVIAKSVQAADDGTVDITMSGVAEEVTTLEVCAINRIRKRVATYYELDCSTLGDDTIRIDAGRLDVGMFATIQQDIFDRTCTGCHGEGRWLDLSAGTSYQTLVGQPSTVFEGRTRVLPGSAAESVLYTILTTSESADLGTDHQTQFTLSEEQFALIGDWIDDGAKE